MDKQAIFEAVKEPLRYLVLAVLPFAITYTASLPYEWAVFATLVLRGLDKFIHEIGKTAENENLTKGLTRF
jgi:hypothetical protein